MSILRKQEININYWYLPPHIVDTIIFIYFVELVLSAVDDQFQIHSVHLGK